MNFNFLTKIFFFFLAYLVFLVSCSKLSRDEDTSESFSSVKKQRTDEESQLQVSFEEKDFFRSFHDCACGASFHLGNVLIWFREMPTSNEYLCPHCVTPLHFFDFFNGEEWKSYEKTISREYQDHFGLKTFISLKLPVSSIRISEDQTTGIIESNRNGIPFIFAYEYDANKNNRYDFIEQSLVLAVEFEHLELIELIALNYIDVCIKNQATFEIMDTAVDHNAVQSMKLLLDLGITESFNAVVHDLYLLKALKPDKSEIFELLLRSSSNPNARYIDGKSLLANAIKYNSQKCISVLIQRLRNPEDVKGPITIDDDIISDMILRILEEGNVQGMKNVLELRISLAKLKSEGYKEIYGIAAVKSKTMFELLLKSGLPLAEDKQTEKFFHYCNAVINDRVENLGKIKKFNINSATFDRLTILHLAIQWSDVKLVDKVLNLGAVVNKSTGKFGYPLYHAIMKDNKKIVLSLLKKGASQNSLNENGDNALIVILKNGKIESFKSLAEHLGRNTFYFRNGFNNLHLAIRFGSIEMVKYLVNNGVQPIKADGTITWLISELAAEENSEMLNLLLKHCNANMYEDYSTELSPLITAIYHNQIKNLELFLGNGYDPNLPVFNGSSTLLHYAVKCGRQDMASMLISYGADCNALDQNGRTAYSYVYES